MNDTGNRVIIGIVTALVVIGAWYLGTSFKPGSTAKTETETAISGSDTSDTAKTSATKNTSSTSGSAQSAVGGEAVSVSDQPAGSFVSVKSVTIAQTGWVAVRDSNGHVLGAARVDAGTHTAVQVSLLRNTETGGRYQVLLYADDGDKAFDIHKDTLVMNADGSIAGASFSALNGD